jgi:hypothetical protein
VDKDKFSINKVFLKHINTQGANPGSIKGTFSGTLYAINPSNPSTFIKYVITNGKYEALVLN